MAWLYASLCVVSLGIAGVFWSVGAVVVLPFAWVMPHTLFDAALFCLLFNTLAVGSDLAAGVARYAPAAMASSGVTWAIGLACVILIRWKQSWPYYESQPA